METRRVSQAFGIVSILLSTAVVGKMGLAEPAMNAAPTSTQNMAQESPRSAYWDSIDRSRQLNTELDQIMQRDTAVINAYHRGVTAYYRGGAGDYQEAETAFREAVAQKPDQPVYQYALGDALLAQGKYADAESAFRAARDKADNVSAYHYAMGIAQLWQQKYSDAETSFIAARDRGDTIAANHYALGYTLLAEQKYTDAEPAFRRASELDRGAETYYGLGLTLLAQKKNDDAATAFQSAIDQKSDVAAYHAALGFARTYEGRYADADAAFRAATRIDPTVPVLPPRASPGSAQQTP